MTDIIHNIIKQGQSLPSNKKYDCFKIFRKNDLYQTIFNEFKDILIRKDMQFDNIASKNKKDHNKNIMCVNFLMNNLINILYQKNSSLNKKHSNTHYLHDVNYIDHNNENSQLKSRVELKNLVTYKNFTILKKNNISKKNKVENVLHKRPSLRETGNLFSNIDFRRNRNLNNVSSVNKTLSTYQNKLDVFRNSKNVISCKIINASKSHLLDGRKTSNTNNFIQNKNILKDKLYKNSIASEKKIFTYNFDDPHVIWKKYINKAILFSIFHKINKAEINLKPKNLGLIHINIKMDQNKAILNFSAYRNSVRILLDNCIPYLRDALKKNKIVLKKINIAQDITLKNCNIHEDKKLINKNYFFNNCKNIFLNKHFFEKNIIEKYGIDLYV